MTPKRFTEYGANSSTFSALTSAIGDFVEPDMSVILERQLAKPVSVLALTEFQCGALKRLGFGTVGKALRSSEREFQKIDYIGPKRSRMMMNAVVASVLEYLSG